MPRRSSAGVHPLVPLVLLEAVRDADRPDGAADAEYAPELLNKRLGTTETIYTQIRRYTGAERHREMIPSTEVAGLARLIARRPDGAVVFRAAGEAAARRAYERLSRVRRALIRLLPRPLARPLARRAARRLARRYFGAELTPDAGSVRLQPPAGTGKLAVAAESGAAGQGFYDAGLHHMLVLLSLA